MNEYIKPSLSDNGFFSTLNELEEDSPEIPIPYSYKYLDLDKGIDNIKRLWFAATLFATYAIITGLTIACTIEETGASETMSFFGNTAIAAGILFALWVVAYAASASYSASSRKVFSVNVYDEINEFTLERSEKGMAITDISGRRFKVDMPMLFASLSDAQKFIEWRKQRLIYTASKIIGLGNAEKFIDSDMFKYFLGKYPGTEKKEYRKAYVTFLLSDKEMRQFIKFCSQHMEDYKAYKNEMKLIADAIISSDVDY